MANPRVPQGTLNRLRASIVWADLPQLNVTPSFLGREAIRLAPDGDQTTILPTMTGTVTSPEPYQPLTMAVNLLKTQQLAQLYQARSEFNTLLGDCTVRPDNATSGLGPFQVLNCAITNFRELNFGGEDAGYLVTIRGFQLLNSSLWDF